MVDDGLWDEFNAQVNMGPNELREWLVDAAGEPGDLPPDIAGVERSRRVVEILGKHRADLTDDDVAVMRSVLAQIHELGEAGPDAPVHDASLRRRLMSLGHDPFRVD